jgi:hypothetical protein
VPDRGHRASCARGGAAGAGSPAASSGQGLCVECRCRKGETLGKEGAGGGHRGRRSTAGRHKRLQAVAFNSGGGPLVISGGQLGLLQHRRRKVRVRRMRIEAGVAGKPSSLQDGNGDIGVLRSRGGGGFLTIDGGREVGEGGGDARVTVSGERK